MEITKKKDNKNNKNLDILSKVGGKNSFERVWSFNYLGVKIRRNEEKKLNLIIYIKRKGK